MTHSPIKLTLALGFGLASIESGHAAAANLVANPIASAVRDIDARYLYASKPPWHAARDRLLHANPYSEVEALKLLGQTLDRLHDPDLHLLSPAQFTALQADTSGSRIGFGLIDFAIDADAEGRPRIVTPLSGSPAERAGLRPGDIIVAIDGNSVRGLGHEQVLDRLRSAGTITVKVIRGRRQLSVRLESSREAIRPVHASLIQLPTAAIIYVRVAQFTPGTADEVASALGDMHNHAAAAFVLDLRHNPGGLLDEAADVVGLFRRVNLGVKRRANGQTEPIGTRRFPDHEVPLAILIDRGTASAAEFVAATLRESRNVILVGSPTAARGQAQLYLPLPNGWGMVVPSASLVTADGRDLKAQPLTPDVSVQGGAASGNDAVLKQAVRLLIGKRLTFGNAV